MVSPGAEVDLFVVWDKKDNVSLCDEVWVGIPVGPFESQTFLGSGFLSCDINLLHPPGLFCVLSTGLETSRTKPNMKFKMPAMS